VKETIRKIDSIGVAKLFNGLRWNTHPSSAESLQTVRIVLNDLRNDLYARRLRLEIMRLSNYEVLLADKCWPDKEDLSHFNWVCHRFPKRERC
jgi:hypothetical protein